MNLSKLFLFRCSQPRLSSSVAPLRYWGNSFAMELPTLTRLKGPHILHQRVWIKFRHLLNVGFSVIFLLFSGPSFAFITVQAIPAVPLGEFMPKKSQRELGLCFLLEHSHVPTAVLALCSSLDLAEEGDPRSSFPGCPSQPLGEGTHFAQGESVFELLSGAFWISGLSHSRPSLCSMSSPHPWTLLIFPGQKPFEFQDFLQTSMLEFHSTQGNSSFPSPCHTPKTVSKLLISTPGSPLSLYLPGSKPLQRECRILLALPSRASRGWILDRGSWMR